MPTSARPYVALVGLLLVAAGLAFAGLRWFDRARVDTDMRAAQVVSVSVDASDVLCTTPSNFDGVNLCALWNDTQDDPGAVKAFDLMGQRLLRFPGGAPAEWYDWQHPLASGWTQLTPKKVCRMAESGHADVIFQTNAATSLTGTNKSTGESYHFDNSGEHAAAWAKYAANAGMKVAYWEIGNEPELDAPESAKSSQDSVYAWYNAKFFEQASSIKSVSPNARIIGPASANSWYWWRQGDLDRFLAAQGNRRGSGLVDGVSVHWYPNDGGDRSWTKERSAPQQWASCMKFIEDDIARNDSRRLPVYITEWNFGGGMNNKSASTLGNALGCADCLGMFRRSGVAGEAFFALQHVDKGWGVLATHHDSRPVNEPSPTYFALEITSHLLSRNLRVSCAADPANDLSVYATSDGSNKVAVMLINKTRQTRFIPLTFSHFGAVNRAVVYTLAGADDKVGDTDVVYNGQAWRGWPAGLPPPHVVPVHGSYTQAMRPYGMALAVLTSAAR